MVSRTSILWLSLLQWNPHKALGWPFRVFPPSLCTYLSQTTVPNATANWPLVNLSDARSPAAQPQFTVPCTLPFKFSAELKDGRAKRVPPWDLVRLHSYRQKIQEGRQADNIIPSKTVLTPSGHPRAHHSFLTHPDLFKLYYPGGPWRNVSMSIMVNNKD